MAVLHYIPTILFISSAYCMVYRRNDQAAAASGYMYRTDSNGPTSYVQFNSATGNPDKFGYRPVGLGAYRHVTPENYLKAVAHKAESQSRGGEKAASGYKKHDEHEQAAKGKHEAEGHKGHYNEEGANKKGEHEEAAHYAEKHAAAKGSEGGSYGEASSHKKGSKTTGFHKVYHKDEYKKEHSFYDEADASGHYDKHGKKSSHHSSEEGGHKKGANEKSAHEGSEFGKKGFYDVERYNSKDIGFKGEKGDEAFHDNHEEYGNKGSKEDNKSYKEESNEDDGDDEEDD